MSIEESCSECESLSRRVMLLERALVWASIRNTELQVQNDALRRDARGGKTRYPWHEPGHEVALPDDTCEG